MSYVRESIYQAVCCKSVIKREREREKKKEREKGNKYCCLQKTDLANVEHVSLVGFEVPYKVINTAQHTAARS